MKCFMEGQGFNLNRRETSWVMMLFQPDLGWSVLELLGRSAVSGCRAPLRKRETERIGGGSPIPFLMPKSVLSCGREDRLLRE